MQGRSRSASLQRESSRDKCYFPLSSSRFVSNRGRAAELHSRRASCGSIISKWRNFRRRPDDEEALRKPKKRRKPLQSEELEKVKCLLKRPIRWVYFSTKTRTPEFSLASSTSALRISKYKSSSLFIKAVTPLALLVIRSSRRCNLFIRSFRRNLSLDNIFLSVRLTHVSILLTAVRPYPSSFPRDISRDDDDRSGRLWL